MKFVSLFTLLCVLFMSNFAQTKLDITFVRKGNGLLAEKKYNDAEIAYRKALQINAKNGIAAYNLALALQLQKKTEEAIKQYGLAVLLLTDKIQKAGAYHNTGNALCGKQEWEKAIEQYKSALRLNPTDMDTKYNLAFAQSKLKQEQQQKQEQKQDSQNKPSENKAGENKTDKNEQKQNPGEMTKEQAQKLQKAIQEQEAKVNDKLQKSDKKAIITTNEKDW